MDRQSDYEKRSALALELSSNEKAIKEAQDVVFDGLKSSVKFIKDTVGNESAETATRLKAATEHLKLAGMYVEHVKHSGKVEGLIVGLPEADGGSQDGPK